MSPDDPERLRRQVAELVDCEHALRGQLGDPNDHRRLSDRAALRLLEEELDQCWDLLHQRRALRAAHLDPGDAHVRSAEQVENYVP